ncbi:putative morphogenesis protein [Rhizobium phage RHph_Y1_11]|nr:putative morphogenesis protein [Rhizobium phage RHph_Y1_11]
MQLSLSLKLQGREYKSPSRGIAAYKSFIERKFEDGVKQVKPEMRAYLEEVVNALIERHSKPYPGGTTSTTLSKRSGKGIEAIRKGVRVTGGQLDTLRARLQIPTPLAYHEYGYSKDGNGKMLTIPLPAALNANGTPKKPNARAWRDTFVTTSKAGNLIIFQRKGRQIVPLYVLKETVKVPARLGARQAFQGAIPHFQERIADEFARQFQ